MKPFRGCNCSDAAGSQHSYADVLNILSKSGAKRQWDLASKSPFFNYRREEEEAEGGAGWHQMRYNDPRSLAIKYRRVARRLRVGGVGMWNANHLDYDDPEQVRTMWGAMPGRGSGGGGGGTVESSSSSAMDRVRIEVVH